MADNLRIFGNTYNNAVGVKMTDTNGNEVVYTAGGGDCLHFIIDAVQGESPGITVIADETKAGEYFNNVKNGKLPILCITAVVGSDTLKAYATELSAIIPHAGEGEESFDISLKMTNVTRDRVLQKIVNISLVKVLATEQYHCEMTVTNVTYPPAG